MPQGRRCSRGRRRLRGRSRDSHEHVIPRRGAKLSLEPSPPAARRDAPFPHDREPATVLGLVHVMSGHEPRRPARRRGVDHFPELAARDRVYTAGGLVEKHDLRLVQQGDGESELLFPSERQSRNEVARTTGKAEALEKRRRPLSNLRIGQAVDATVEPDVLSNGEIRVQAEALAHVADVAPNLQTLRTHIESGNVRLALGRRQQADEHLDGGRLAGAIGTEKAEYFAGTNVEGDVIDRDERSEPAGEVARLYRGRRRLGAHAASPPPQANKPFSMSGANGLPPSPAK